MSADPRGYYRILSVAPSATQEQIKQAFRALAKALHPDLNRGQDTTAAFQAVNEAYSVLSDPSQRAAYDQTGSPSQTASARGASPAARPDFVVEP
jgi:molecular chaperone DnaJ